MKSARFAIVPVVAVVCLAMAAYLWRDRNGGTAPLAEKLLHQCQLYDRAQRALVQRVSVGRTMSRREWERLLQPSGVYRWTSGDLDALREQQRIRIDEAARTARRASSIDLDEVRRRGRVPEFCAALPKGGMLHVHPNGTLYPETVEQLLTAGNPVVGGDAKVYAKAFRGSELQFLERYGRDVRYLTLSPDDQARFRALFFLPEGTSDFRRFGAIFPLVGLLRQTPNAWQVITEDFFTRAQAQRVRYVEFTMHVEPTADAVRELEQTARLAQERYGITCKVNAAFDRSAQLDENLHKVRRLLGSLREHPAPVIVGIDLAGEESAHPAFEAGQLLYGFLLAEARAKERLRRTMHAGVGDARNARDAMLLGAERIGHGTQLLRDPVALACAAEREIAVEANLVSNVRLRYANDFAQHPFLPLLRLGLRVSLSTDDEGIFGTDITNEFAAAITDTDITYAEVRQLIINSIATSFAPPAETDALLAAVEEDLRQFEESWLATGPGGN
jgi:adenosine deaminase CECR1